MTIEPIQAEFIPKIGGYIARYPTLNLEIDISHCHTSKWGKTTAEMIFKYSKPPQVKSNVIRWRTVDLIDSKSVLVRELLSAVPTIKQWAEILEDVCIRTLLAIRQGEPVIKIDTLKEIKAPEYLIYPLLLKNMPNVMFGTGGIGKSELAKLVSLGVFLPWRNNPLNWIVPAESVNVLYLDWEADYDTFQWQFAQLRTGLDLPLGELIDYRRCFHPLADDIEQIQQWVETTKAGLVVVDSMLGAIGGKSSKDTETASEYYNALRQLGNVTVLQIGHTSWAEAPKDDKKHISGTHTFTDRARNVWEVKRAQDTKPGELVLGLWNTKYNFKQQAPVAYRINFNDDNSELGTTVAATELDAVEEFEKVLPMNKRIHNLLAATKKWSTVKEIAGALELPKSKEAAVRATLHKYTKYFQKWVDVWGLLDFKIPNEIKQGELK